MFQPGSGLNVAFLSGHGENNPRFSPLHHPVGPEKTVARNFPFEVQVPVFIYSPKSTFMLRWTIAFFVIALIAAFLGFGGLAAGAASIAKICFFIFLVLFVLSLLFGGRFSKSDV